MRKRLDKKLYRVIDANFNRAKEGLRVCEDIFRFVYDQPGLTRRYKEIRHRLTATMVRLPLVEVLQARDAARDVGRISAEVKFPRKDLDDLFYANSQRIKESIRVLEEFAKLLDDHLARQLKELRYQVYEIEQKVVKKGKTVSHLRYGRS